MALRISLVMTALLFSLSKALLKASFTSSGMEKFIVAMAESPLLKVSTINIGSPGNLCKILLQAACVAGALEPARHPR